MISCIILSAGLSSRFGSPKALASVHGQRVISLLCHKLIESQCQDILVVLGSDHEQIKQHVLKHTSIRIVYNKDYLLGQTSSFHAGLNNLSSQSTGVLLWPIDYPLIEVSTITQLIKAHTLSPESIIIPTHDNHRGHPPLFPSHLFNALAQIPCSQGINTIYTAYSQHIKNLPVHDPAIRYSFNTPEELKKISSFKKVGPVNI